MRVVCRSRFASVRIYTVILKSLRQFRVRAQQRRDDTEQRDDTDTRKHERDTYQGRHSARPSRNARVSNSLLIIFSASPL